MDPLKWLNFKLQSRPAIVDFKNRIARNALGTFDNCTLCGNKPTFNSLISSICKNYKIRGNLNLDLKIKFF